MHIAYTPDPEAPKLGNAVKRNKVDMWLGRYVSVKQQRCPKRRTIDTSSKRITFY